MKTSPTLITRRRMTHQKRRDTACEMAVRRAVHAKGLRYRIDVKPLHGLNRKADIVFFKSRLAIFIDGCFWHGCPEHRSPSKTNTEWWAEKIASNRRRDQDTDVRLQMAGWTVIRAWEHDDAHHVADRIVAVMKG